MAAAGTDAAHAPPLPLLPLLPEATPLCDEYRQRVAGAMGAFLEARSGVEAHLYADTAPCLRYFRAMGLRMGVVTNGNANVTALSLDGQLCFDAALCLTAGDTGALKPSVVPFLAALQRSGVVPARVLFVGDQLDKVRITVALNLSLNLSLTLI